MENLANLDDLARAIGGEIDPDDTVYAEGLLMEASALIRAYARALPEKDVPVAVRLVAARAAARAYSSEAESPGLSGGSATAGPFAHSYRFVEGTTDGGPWLTKADKLILRRWRGGAYTVSTW